jgi:hypothetical protein
MGLKLPQPPRTVQLIEPETSVLASFFVDSTFFKSKPPLFKRIVKLDSSGQFVSAMEAVDQTEFNFPAVVDIETYIRMRLAYDRSELFKTSAAEQIEKAEEKKSGAIELDIPVRIKSETFTRIFGSDRVSLRVTGNISFDLSGRSEKRSGAAVSRIQERGSFSPRFNQTQQFTIEGKIGEKVTVSVEQNSEATFDFENTLKLKYDGGEDEIIQSIEAGNIGLSLPSTKYVIFGGSNKGLFGIKSEMKVGNFYFTGIASLEKGEQKKLTISGSSSESQTELHDYDFIKNRYFFIDTYYKDYFEKGFSEDLQQWFYESDSRLIREFEVYKTESYANQNAREGIAVLNPNDYAGLENLNDIETIPGEIEKATFAPLEQGKDYEYDYARGFFWLRQEVRDNEVLAIAYQTVDNSGNINKVGTLFSDVVGADSTKPYVLRLIKPQSMQPAYEEVWPLMMRNVYFLGGTNIEEEGFDLSIEFNLGGEHETIQQVQPRKSFSYLAGLDRVDENGAQVEEGDKKIDDNPFLINRAEGILIFPSLQPFDPVKGSRFENDPNNSAKEGLADTNRVRIYNINDQTERVQRTKFEIIVTSKSTKSTFDLGFNVLEASEEVLLNGSPLKRNEDYLIDYFTGQITLISSRAKRSSSNIEIKYEKATIFQLDKKTILGGRAEYRFWEDSFLGFTALYMNKSTLDQRVRVGQEPFRNLVWDLNTALKFKPRFLTQFVDALPFIETNEPSSFNVEAEFAQVLPNPNTMDNEGTGDVNGVAFIDDFEGAKRTTTLGIRYRTWTESSPPKLFQSLNNSNVPDTLAVKAKGRIVWYNPFNQVLIKDIWPNRDVNAETGQTTDVLGVQVWRETGQDPDSAWAGIMRSTASFSNQQRTKFIEMWVKEDTIRNPNRVRINIDIGQISEDWYMKTVSGEKPVFAAPSWRGLNTEDKNRNGVLDANEDTGVDGIPNGQFGDDPFDNWREPDRGLNNYDGINGTEGNSRAQGANYPDSEDLDGNGQVNLINEYFEYSFTLDPQDERSSKWLSGSTDEKGWRQFRIPLKEYVRKVGNPDTTFQSIYFVRIWFSNLTEERKELFIATFDFVGNEWEEEGIADSDTSTFVKDDSLFSITVYNSEENAVEIPGGPEPYDSPPGVSGIVDRITRAKSKEQSMVLRIVDLQPGALVQARKTLFGEILSLVNYKRLRMFVHGDQFLPSSPTVDSSRVQVYIRFGSDEKNYYEYGQDVYAGWATINEFDIDLDELSRTKFIDDSDKKVKIQYLPDKPLGYYKVFGNPSLNTTRYFRVGVRNRDPVKAFTGEIWLDELRVSDVRQETGTALRLSTSLKLADLLSFNGNWESKDADFHDIKTQFGTGNTIESQNYSGVFHFDRFLPDNWNLSIPIDARASFNKNIPKYFPRTDILTNYSNNSIDKKLKSLFGLRDLDPELESQVSYSEVYGMGTTIKKRSRSKAWYLYYTIDQISFDIDYSLKNSRNYQTQFNKSTQWRGSVSYGIPFGKNNFIEPFKFFTPTPVLKILADQKLYYTPNSLNMSLNVSDTDQKNKLRTEEETTRQENVNSTRKLSMGYRLLQSVNLNYSRTHKADADYVGLNGKDLVKSIFSDFYFGKETDINQTFKMDYKPKIFTWLTADYSYSANFRYYFTNLAKNQKQSNSKVTRRVNFSFSPSKIANMIYKPKADKKKPQTRSRRPARGQKQPKPEGEDEEPEKEKEEKKEAAQAFKIPNPLILIYEFFNAFQKIQSSYTWDQNVTNSYVKSIPTWRYQFGLSQDPGVPQDTSITNQSFIGPSITDSRTLSSSLNFDISKNIRTTFNHQYNTSKTSNDKTQSGNESVTFMALGEDPSVDFKGIGTDFRSLIPDWTIKISGLEKFLFFKEFAKTVSLDHSRTGKYTSTKKLANNELVPASESFSHNFGPLVGVTINWIWGINSSIRLNKSTTYNFKSGGGATRSETSAFSISASYATKGGFKIPIPIWPFKGATFKNEINFTLAYDRSTNLTFQKQFNQTSFQETQKNNSWKLRPSATYRFNTRVSGSVFYETGVTENKISGEFSWNEFGITVNIAIRD